MPQVKYKIVFFLISTLFILNSCKTSFNKIGDKNANYIPYYLTIYEADSLYNAGNFKATYYLLDSLFKKYEPINITFYNEYEIYLNASIQIKKTKNANKISKSLIKNYGYKYKDLIADSLLKPYIKFSKQKATHLEKTYINSLDLTFREQLKKMDSLDQEVRNRPAYLKDFREMEKVDVTNDSILKNYILKNGYPSSKKIGISQIYENEKGGFALALFLNHFSYNGSYEFYKDALPKFIKDGTCNPSDYAALVDRWYEMSNNDTLFYYRFLYRKIENNTDLIKLVNKRRKEIGLPSINQEIFLYRRLSKSYNL